MKITTRKLASLLAQAYRDGCGGCADLAAQYGEETASASSEEIPEFNRNEGWKVFKSRELKLSPPGTVFSHATRGTGIVEQNALERHMRFANGDICHFYTDEQPWDEPMKILVKK